MNETQAKQLSSLQSIADTIGESRKTVRCAVARLEALELITTEADHRGTTFRITSKGRRYLFFNAEGYNDFAAILDVLKSNTLWRILSIVYSLTLNSSKND